MFSGIVEEMATLVALKNDKENVDLTLTCSFTDELKIDQSVAHNGVCLTVVAIDGDRYTVTAMKETLDRSNLGELKVGDRVNVERSMLMNGRLDGHIVQGHVDGTAVQGDARRQRINILHLRVQVRPRDGGAWLLHGRQGLGYGERRFAHRMQPYRELVHRGYHSLHTRQHQLLRHQGGHTREHRVRHTRQVYRASATAEVNWQKGVD